MACCYSISVCAAKQDKGRLGMTGVWHGWVTLNLCQLLSAQKPSVLQCFLELNWGLM